MNTQGDIIYAVILAVFAGCVYAGWRQMTGDRPIASLSLIIFGLGLVGAATWITDQKHVLIMPGSESERTAEVEDKDFDPTHENYTEAEDLTPSPILIGTSIFVGLVTSPDTIVTHVQDRYSILLRWADGQAWIPVDGFTYRKVSIGRRVKVQLRMQREVSLVSEEEPRLMASLITSSVWPKSKQ